MKKQGNVSEMLPHDDAVRHYLHQGEDTLALEALIEQYQGAILRYCYCHLLDRDLAQEVAQDVFVTAFEKLSCLRQDASIHAWLYSIATNKCLERRRNSSRRETLRHNNQSLIERYAHCTPPSSLEENYILESQRRLVWQALQRLRIYERQLVVLRYLEELVYEDIARILHVSSRTVERHLPGALAKFFKAYERCQRHVI
ncbi:MAG: RNA polymerase sigma factor [Candidatus Tectimicrobiota bacterium]